MAAISTRLVATVSGPTSRSATAAKKNEPPHTADSSTNRPHSRGPMARPAAVDFCGNVVPVFMMAARMPETRRGRYPVLALQFTGGS